MKKKIIWPKETKEAIALLLMKRPDIHDFFKKRAYSYSITVKKLLELWLLQKRKCALCGDILKLDRTTHVDHILPKAQGGENKADNYQLVCDKCNYAKRDLTSREFLLLCLKISAHNQANYISKEEKMTILEEKWKRENRENREKKTDNNINENIIKIDYLLGKKIKRGQLYQLKNNNNKYYEKLLASAGLI